MSHIKSVNAIFSQFLMASHQNMFPYCLWLCLLLTKCLIMLSSTTVNITDIINNFQYQCSSFKC